MVCQMHGFAAPQVKEKAHRVVLEELVAPALIRLKHLVEDDSTPVRDVFLLWWAFRKRRVAKSLPTTRCGPSQSCPPTNPLAP